MTVVADRHLRDAGHVATVWDVDTGEVVAALDGPTNYLPEFLAFEAAGGVDDDPAGLSPPAPCLVVVANYPHRLLYVWTVATAAAASPTAAVAAAVVLPRTLPLREEPVEAVTLLDAARGLLVGHHWQSVTVLAVAGGRPDGTGVAATAVAAGPAVVSRVALLGRVRRVRVVGPRAVAVEMMASSFVQLELVRGAGT